MTKIQVRRDTSTNWTTNNPTPAAGEPCYETDTGKLKMGDGVTAYNSLPYIGDGSGGVTDTYTKAETNALLETKEDNITALSPLTLEEKTSSTGSVGFTVSESNTLMPSSDVISLNYSLSSPTTIASTFNNYIVIPYSYSEKTVVRIPCNSVALPTHNTSAFLGYLDDGVVQPLVYFPICQSTNNASTNYVYTMDTNNPNASAGTHPNNTAGSYNADGLIEGKWYSYLTTYYSPQWNQYALTSYTKNYESSGKDSICFQRYNFDSTEEKAAIEKANCVVISYGVSLNQFPIDLNICGKFPYKGDYATGTVIPYDAPLDDVADLTDNILDFTTVTTNELALNIDNSTIKVNDSGQLYANVNSAPTNMVTTDTNQTITGEKTFNNLRIASDLNTTKLTFMTNSDGSTYISTPLQVSEGSTRTITVGSNSNYELSLRGTSITNGYSKKFLVQGSVTSGSNNLVINETTDGIQITSNIPTGALKYWTGTEAEYTALETKDADTLYRTTDTNKVYLGTIQLGGNA